MRSLSFCLSAQCVHTGRNNSASGMAASAFARRDRPPLKSTGAIRDGGVARPVRMATHALNVFHRGADARSVIEKGRARVITVAKRLERKRRQPRKLERSAAEFAPPITVKQARHTRDVLDPASAPPHNGIRRALHFHHFRRLRSHAAIMGATCRN